MSGLRYKEADTGNSSVATELVGTDNFQIVKLCDPTPGSSTPIGTAANPMKMSAAALPLPSGASTDATLAPIKNRFSPSTGTPVTVSAAGATTVHTPAAGMRIRLKWIGLSSPETNTAANLVDVKLGGILIYRWDMGKPGAFAHGTVREGPVDGVLSVETSAAQTLRVNMDLEEY